jgi:hypothetical protein
VKDRVQDAVGGFEPAKGRRVRPFERGSGDRATDEQHRRHHQDELRLEGEPDPAPLDHDVADDGEAETAEQHQDADRYEDHRHVGQVGEAAEAAEEVDAAVVERRDRVEQAPPRRRDRVLAARREHGTEDHCASRLTGNREDEDAPDDGRDAAEVRQAPRGLDAQPVAEACPATDKREQEERRSGHEREATDLDQQQDHELTERAPVLGGVVEDEAGGRDGRGGHEQGLGGRGLLAALGGDGQREENGPDRGEDRKRRDQDAPWRWRSPHPLGLLDLEVHGDGPLDADPPVTGALPLVDRHRRAGAVGITERV